MKKRKEKTQYIDNTSSKARADQASHKSSVTLIKKAEKKFENTLVTVVGAGVQRHDCTSAHFIFKS